MREYIVKTKKAGEAVIVELPKELLATEQIGAGMILKIKVQKTCSFLWLKPKATAHLDQMTPGNCWNSTQNKPHNPINQQLYPKQTAKQTSTNEK